jgi:hypothetical protein
MIFYDLFKSTYKLIQDNIIIKLLQINIIIMPPKSTLKTQIKRQTTYGDADCKDKIWASAKIIR